MTLQFQNIILNQEFDMRERNIEKAIYEVKKTLNKHLEQRVELYLFGSVARGEHLPDSDIDILVLVSGQVNTSLEEKIIDLIYGIELEYNVVFGVVIYSKDFWSSQKAKVMPFYQNVQKEAQRI